MKVYSGLTVIGVTIALSSAMYLSQSNRPYDLVAIKFCPKTANLPPRYGEEFSQRSQESLDKKYCSYEHKLLKEIWSQKQFESSTPLPESSFSIRHIPASNKNAIWFLVAPVASGIAYLSWTKKAEIDELSAHSELEAYKTCIKISTVSNQNEREFKNLQTNRVWDKQKVKHGFISIEAMQDKLIRQQEIQDKTHTSTLKQFDLADSDMDKKIAENIRDKHKADKESQKILGKKSDSDSDESSNPDSYIQERVNQLLEALKQWEDGWLYTIIKNNKPLWLIGSQGSGKTNTAGCIAIIRKYCFDAPIYQLIDRHATGENWKVWQLLDAQIKAESESEIGQALEDACERWLARIKEVPKQKQQLVIDEFTNLKKIPSCKESAMKFFSMHLTDTRKAKEYFIGINHYFTNESTVEGTFEARKAGTIQIKKFSANGETPLPRVQIVHGLVDSNGNELEEVEVTLPSWFEAVKIYNHFNGSKLDFEG
ncbi:hypothetical protein H6G81_23305 [Scytonema hofmannii FACHB-248]|uniref:Uncharacterized protein n=1 Tax=Scytonema hofmannii FACHB-248 TaxID=1842502 RepID=A0ABR8GW82_9CYAN|nr:hypothetical protein [Scytonema hofmannii]MBD2607375.1 hypothetical protein [Scytonema hofmannii FACHB-248]